jgi:hypothetical protein
MGQLKPKLLQMKHGGVEGFRPTQDHFGDGTVSNPIQIEEGASDTIYILAPSSTGEPEFIPVPTVRPSHDNVPVELNNYFRFEEMENDTAAQAGEPEEAEQAVVSSVVTSVSSSVPVVQPADVESGYSTPTVNRYLTYTRRHYNQTRFGLDAFERPNGHTTAAGRCGIRNPPSVLSRVESQAILPQAEQETESEDDKSVDLGFQDSTRSGESWEYKKDEPDDDDDIVYV